MDSSNDSFERLLLSSDEEEEGCANDEPQAALVKIGSSICDDSSSSDDDDVTLNPPQQLDWRSTFVARETFEFSDENVGILDDTLYEHVNAMQFWRVFLTDAVIQLILTETNSKLLSKRTDYVGTLRRNETGIPQEVKYSRLRRGEIIGYGDSGKPKAIEYYNVTKGFVDSSDQMTSYTPFVIRTTKCFEFATMWRTWALWPGNVCATMWHTWYVMG
ncbi:unnamed protein product [Nippostrongylus brasiliensis]|uniref:SET domain-containing protein n=1 Tax=Nippostrongylus brasiliensis TaxID=27835 RepID=A0A0N4YVI5_NIPBR|nr:unnamed protein product [Nippostrongylus brasiliensis]